MELGFISEFSRNVQIEFRLAVTLGWTTQSPASEPKLDARKSLIQWNHLIHQQRVSSLESVQLKCDACAVFSSQLIGNSPLSRHLRANRYPTRCHRTECIVFNRAYASKHTFMKYWTLRRQNDMNDRPQNIKRDCFRHYCRIVINPIVRFRLIACRMRGACSNRIGNDAISFYAKQHEKWPFYELDETMNGKLPAWALFEFDAACVVWLQYVFFGTMLNHLVKSFCCELWLSGWSGSLETSQMVPSGFLRTSRRSSAFRFEAEKGNFSAKDRHLLSLAPSQPPRPPNIHLKCTNHIWISKWNRKPN